MPPKIGRFQSGRDIAEHAAGLLAGVVLQAGDSFLGRYREIFGDRCYALAELHCGPDDARQLGGWIQRARRARVPLVAAGDVRYHDPSRRPLHDVLTATRAGVTVAEAGELLFPNAQRHLKPIEEIVAAFALAPDAVRRSVEVAERCAFSLDELRYRALGDTVLDWLTQCPELPANVRMIHGPGCPVCVLPAGRIDQAFFRKGDGIGPARADETLAAEQLFYLGRGPFCLIPAERGGVDADEPGIELPELGKHLLVRQERAVDEPDLMARPFEHCRNGQGADRLPVVDLRARGLGGKDLVGNPGGYDQCALHEDLT